MKKDRWKQRITIYSFLACIVSMTMLIVIFPKEQISKAERRRLATRPQLAAESILDKSFMEDAEDYLLDHFPFREGLRRIKAQFAYHILKQKENNGIYVDGGYASRLEYPLNEDSVVRMADKLVSLKHQYFPNENTWYAVIPDKNYFLAEPNGYPSMDYDRMLELFAQKLDNSGERFDYIDIAAGLKVDDYYRTDTHWRQERLPDTVAVVGEAMGINEALNLQESNFERHEIKDFYGVYYGQSALPMEPDTIVYLTNETTDAASVWNLEENLSKDGQVTMPEHAGAVWNPVYQTQKLEEPLCLDQYDVFLGGAASLQIIKSPKANTDRRLVIFRDSFTSSLAPLLLEAYSEITLIDLRYISTPLVGEYVNFEGADILFLYNTSIINNASMLK